MAKARNWCFTLNNYTEDDIKHLQTVEQYVFQEETGENGTPHLQGLIMFKNARALTAMKKINGRCHWEICRNKIASIQYCTKDSSRTGTIFTNIELPKFGHKDTDTTRVAKEVFLRNEIEKNLQEDLQEIRDGKFVLSIDFPVGLP